MHDATTPINPYRGNNGERVCFAKSPASTVWAIKDVPVVYYVMRLGHVKIGTTRNIVTRLRKLGVKREDVLAVEFASYGTETMRHRQFAHLLEPSLGREHFRLEPDLMDHIVSLRKSLGIDD
jgi:hypothetical protein